MGADPDLAVEPERAAHCFGQPAGEHETEAGATFSASLGSEPIEEVNAA